MLLWWVLVMLDLNAAAANLGSKTLLVTMSLQNIVADVL
jgi:hypothetical protein